MKNFAITGVAGYVAPRHLQAIKDTGNDLIAACDPHDSVGILDRYFPETAFFTEFERFDRHLEMLRRKPGAHKVDYISICTPNHLHDAHIRLSLRVGADAICEKPLVLNPWNLDQLEELEKEYGKKVFTILQLRLHPSLIELKKKLEGDRKRHSVDLTYITSRGVWYNYSWKGVKEKSGGIATNIGIHFFDMLIWLFGDAVESRLTINELNKMGGELRLKDADVKWFLSLDRNDLPRLRRVGAGLPPQTEGKTTYRSIKVDDEEVHFHEGFTDLHTRVYEETLAGRGFGIAEARKSIELVYKLR